MSAFDFVQWCFRSPLSGFVTILLLGGAANTLIAVAAALGGKK